VSLLLDNSTQITSSVKSCVFFIPIDRMQLRVKKNTIRSAQDKSWSVKYAVLIRFNEEERLLKSNRNRFFDRDTLNQSKRTVKCHRNKLIVHDKYVTTYKHMSVLSSAFITCLELADSSYFIFAHIDVKFWIAGTYVIISNEW